MLSLEDIWHYWEVMEAERGGIPSRGIPVS
jgi:hypothetical protein